MLDAKIANQTLSVVVVLALIYALYIVQSTVFIFLASVLFAYLLLPAVDAIHKKLLLLPGNWKRRYSRIVALIIVYMVS
jgi:predicted PurR-regulated permease PerM